MSKLIYVTNMTLDGYIEDERGSFEFFPVDAEVFRAHTDLVQSAGTLLYGRRLYETMAPWETDPTLGAQSDQGSHGWDGGSGLMADFATAWQKANKVVYSTTLTAPSTANTRIERHFDPTAVRELKAAASSDITTDARADLELTDERRFGNGVVLLRYRPRGG